MRLVACVEAEKLFLLPVPDSTRESAISPRGVRVDLQDAEDLVRVIAREFPDVVRRAIAPQSLQRLRVTQDRPVA